MRRIGLFVCFFAVLALMNLVPGGSAWAQPGGGRGFAPPAPGSESGFATFQTQCSICHGNPDVEKAPSPEAIREMPPERIYTALAEGGVMAVQGQALSDIQKQKLAEFMSGRPLGSSASGAAADMPNQCARNPRLADPSRGASWNGWSPDPANQRFQSAEQAGLTAADVPKLKLKWVFAYPSGTSSNAQPTVASGRVYAGSDNGYVYSLDADTGCVYWSFEAGSIIRNPVVIAPIEGAGSARYAAYFGDGHANVFALDAQTGELLWKTRVDDHFVARITAGINIIGEKLLVPVSSSEEFSSGNVAYSCCTSRGSVVALNKNTGAEIWKAWVVPEEPKPYKTQSNGVVLYKPAGGSVWNSPTIDTVANAVYFGTGDATTAPSPLTTDAVMAVDLDTGKLLWAYQATKDDVFMGGCNGAEHSEACPEPMGPDMDIGNSPVLVKTKSGKRIVFGGTKRGEVFAVDPDNKGALLYRVAPTGDVSAPPAQARFTRGSIVWGGAADAEHVYYGTGNGGLVAMDPDSGKTVWTFSPAAPGGNGTSSLGAAPTVIPGVVFEGATNGMLYAVRTEDGSELWSFDTSQMFDTVNKVEGAHGGAISVSGAVAVDGQLFVGSGYGISSGASAGNVLLAFEVE